MSDYDRAYDFAAHTTAHADEVDTELNRVKVAIASKVDKATDGVTLDPGASGANGLAKGSFSAYRNTALSLATGGVLVADVEDWDISGWYDTANGRFTPQLAGYYRLSGAIRASAAITADKSWAAYLIKNGLSANRVGSTVFQRGTTRGPISALSVLVAANGSTDYFQLAIAHEEAGSVALDPQQSWFQGELVGRS